MLQRLTLVHPPAFPQPRSGFIRIGLGLGITIEQTTANSATAGGWSDQFGDVNCQPGLIVLGSVPALAPV